MPRMAVPIGSVSTARPTPKGASMPDRTVRFRANSLANGASPAAYATGSDGPSSGATGRLSVRLAPASATASNAHSVRPAAKLPV